MKTIDEMIEVMTAYKDGKEGLMNKNLEQIIAGLDETKIKQAMKDTLTEARCYRWSDKGIDTIYQTWLEDKSKKIWGNEFSIFEILGNHPDYIPEKGMIVKRVKFHRFISIKDARCIMRELKRNADVILQPAPTQWSRCEIEDYQMLACNRMHILPLETDTYRGRTRAEWKEEYNRWDRIKSEYDSKYAYFNGKWRDKKCMRLMNAFEDAMDVCLDYTHTDGDHIAIGNSLANYWNGKFPELKLRANAPLHKAVRKICCLCGMDKVEWKNGNGKSRFEELMAQLSDACVANESERILVVSLHPNDFYRASYGYHWTSCMNTDKRHVRVASAEGMYGDGCTQSGTESYMLDSHTVVVYTLPSSYEGADYDIEDKINRQLYHVGDGFMICGRIYPQANDSSQNHDMIYDEWRHHVETIIDECLGVSHRWNHVDRVTSSGWRESADGATHYEDYACKYCDYAGATHIEGATPFRNIMTIGHAPICPNCGRTHHINNTINCGSCIHGLSYDTFK